MEARRLPIDYQRKALEIVARIKVESERSNWDRRNEATGVMYCAHGTMIGTWDGPDYMCGPCEDGRSPYEVALARAWELYRRDRVTVGRRVAEAIRDTLVETAQELGAMPLSGAERFDLMERALKSCRTE